MATTLSRVPKEHRAWFKSVRLRPGKHEPNGEACAMEVAAKISGGPWTDHPVGVSPVVAAFLRSWNDAIPDDETRTRLIKPLIPLTLGTAASPEVELRRSFMSLDWFLREHVPAWFDLTPSLKPFGDALRAADEIVSLGAARSIRPKVAAARAAARDAAWDAAWDAAGDAARAAAGDAARAAARDAARDAARAAAIKVLAPTVSKLQSSAADLVRRMCEAT